MRQREHRGFFQGYATGALQRENLAQAALKWAEGDSSPEEDADDFEADLDELGVDPDALAAWREKADAELERKAEPEFTLWPENAAAFGVFTRCHWQRIVAGERLMLTGIDAAEIRNVMEMLDIPRADWPAVLDGVRLCISTVLPVLSAK